MIDLLPREGDAFWRPRRLVARPAALVVAAAALALAGCSVSMPLPGFIDDEPIGAIKPKAAPAPLSSAYDSRDWRLAEPTLSATLHARDGDERGTWSNPETGAHGEFIAVAGSFQRDGLSCRVFVARVVGKDGKGDKAFQGVGCPREGEEAAIYDVSPWTGL
jgi:hypothetical protein